MEVLCRSSDHWHHYGISLGADPENAHIAFPTGFNYSSQYMEEQIAVQIRALKCYFGLM